MLNSKAPPCPFCTSVSREVFVAREHRIWNCAQCDYRFCVPQNLAVQHLERHYGDDYFFGGEAGYQDYPAERELLVGHGRRYGQLLNKYSKHESGRELLDVGAAAGFVMQGFHQAGWKPSGIEPNSSMCELARQDFGFEMSCSSLEDCGLSQQFDVISMIQVIAHFHDLHRALESAADRTKPGGHWLIESWNFHSLSARVLGKHWHEYSPPTVLHWFTPRGLQNIARRFDMQLVAQGRPKKYINGEHAKSLLQYRLDGTLLGRLAMPLLNLLPDRLRIRYPAEDLFWILFSKKG